MKTQEKTQEKTKDFQVNNRGPANSTFRQFIDKSHYLVRFHPFGWVYDSSGIQAFEDLGGREVADMEIAAALVVPDDQMLTAPSYEHTDAFGEVILEIDDRLANSGHGPSPFYCRVLA